MIVFPEYTNNLELQKRNAEFVEKEWESPTRQKIFSYLEESFVQQNPFIVDIGANVGIFTIKWLDKFPSTVVFAFEPDIDNFEILYYNCRNYVAKWQLVPHLCGIFYGVSEGKVFGTGDKNPGGLIFEGVDKIHLHPHVGTLVEYNKKIQVGTLEEIFNNKTMPIVPWLVKMDVEGSEYNIIENSTLLKEVRFLIIEFHGHNEQYLREYLSVHLPEHHCHVLTNEAYGTDHHYIAFLEKDPITKEF